MVRLIVSSLLWVSLVAGCGSLSATPSGILAPTHASPEPSADTTPEPTDSPASPRPSGSSTASTATPAPAVVVTTVVDGVRVRSEPSVGESSERYSPLLPEGTDLLVIAGPTPGDGYEWLLVVPIAFTGLQGAGYGWVAAASRDGQPWIEAQTLVCPPRPEDVASLAALSGGMALACFARDPITVRARIVRCYCEIDGPPTQPVWLSYIGDGQGSLLVDPSDTRPPDRFEDWLILHLDPDAGVASIPVDELVDVVGIFDHPAAEDCRVGSDPVEPPDSSPSWSPTLSCRFAFAVTALEVVNP